MSRLELDRQINEENHFRLTGDGEIEGGIALPIPEKTKRKNLPTLRRGLDFVYDNADEDQKKLLGNLEKECATFMDMDLMLSQHKKDYLIRKLAFDVFYFGVPAAVMMFDIATNNISSGTLIKGAVGLAVGNGIVFASEVYTNFTDYEIKRDGRFVRVGSLVKEMKAMLKGEDKSLSDQGETVIANLRLLGLEETQELREEYDTRKVIGNVLEFFENKKKEERLKQEKLNLEREVKRRAGLDN